MPPYVFTAQVFRIVGCISLVVLWLRGVRYDYISFGSEVIPNRIHQAMLWVLVRVCGVRFNLQCLCES